MSRLALTGEITDEAGMASAILAAEVGYPGSSIAFAQLLSGMQRSGLIEREVRGKRTYRIAAAAGAAAAEQRRAARRPGERRRAGRAPADRGPGDLGPGAPASASGERFPTGDAGPADFDYDELARRLLVQVVRRLAAGPGEAPAAPDRREDAALEQTVAGLERELASVRTMHGTLSAENARLREQLRAARRSLALAQDRAAAAPPVGDQLDATERKLLERLLSPPGSDTRREAAETG
jgi:hypothetical protein